MRLIDSDALMKRINRMVFTSDMTTTIAVSMATRWIEEEPVVNPWIPCDKQLPERESISLACGRNGGMRVVRYHGNGEWKVVGSGMDFHPVAWMPLPERYRGDSK